MAMKRVYLVVPSILSALGLVSCDTLSGPISSGSFDPLTPPGADSSPDVVEPTGGVVPGQIAVIALDNAGFFNKKPTGEGDPDKLLRAGTQVKVVSTEGSYLKVELDSGEVGYVPAVMVDDPSAVPSPNEIQVYPAPPPGGGDVPIIPLEPMDPGDPQAPASDSLPSVIEPEEPPATPDLPPVPDDPDAPDEDADPTPPPVPELENKPAE
jgi:hypothetical protein